MMPRHDDALEQPSKVQAAVLIVGLLAAALYTTFHTEQNPVLQAHILATACIVAPAFLLAHSDNRFLVPYLILVWAISPEVRRVVDWMQGEFHPRSLISVAPMLATSSLIIPVFRQRISVPVPLYRALGAIFLALGYAGFVGYIRNELPAIFELGATVTPIMVLLYAAGRPMNPRERDMWVLSLAWIGIGVAIYGIVQYIYAPPWDVMWMWAVRRDIIAIGRPEPYGIRVFSTFGAPLQCSLFLMTALIPMLVESRWRKGASYLGATLIAYALLLTITRTAWVAAVAGVFAYVLVSRFARKVQVLLAIGLVGVALVLALPYLPGYETVSSRVQSISALQEDTSASDRTSLLASTWRAIVENPIGSGMGTYGVGTRLTTKPGQVNTGLDNGYVGLALSYGWFGLVMFLQGLWMLVRAVRQYRFDPVREPFVRLSFAVMVSYLVYTGSAYGAGVFVLLLGIALPFGMPMPTPPPEPEPLYVDAAQPLRTAPPRPDMLPSARRP